MPILNALLDGVTAAGLFGKLNWPGGPTEFVDSRTAEEFDANEAAGEFIQKLNRTKATHETRTVSQTPPLSRHT